MISGDLRSPTLHQHFKLDPAAGFAECLRLAASDPKQLNSTLSRYVRSVPGELHLDLFDAGAVTPDPGLLLSGNALNALLTKLRRLHYKYILVDSAPILGLGDTQFMARHVDDILLVARLDAIAPDSAADLTDLLGRLDLHPLGVAVVGAKIELSPYYLNGPAPRGVDEAAGARVAQEQPESVDERRARIAANRAQQSQAG
jgi:Mrp family chromosome partitioning ATPase